jgi:hypothetical protein
LDQELGEKDKTEKQAPLSSQFFCHYGYPKGSSTLMPRSGAWTGGWDTSIHRRLHLASHLEIGALRPPVVTFAERAGSQLGVELTPGLSPLSILCRSVPSVQVASSGCRPQLGQALSESSNEVMMSLIFFSPVSNVPVIVYRHG